MEDYTTAMGKNGKLKLSKKALKILGWAKGDEVTLEVVGDKIIVKRVGMTGDAEHPDALSGPE